MTLQEAFDFVLESIRQREYARARSPDGPCVMCTAEGIQCAVGLLANAKPFWSDSRSWDAAVQKLGGQDIYKEKAGFLCGLQGCHDQKSTPTEFERDMRYLATQYGLAYKEPV